MSFSLFKNNKKETGRLQVGLIEDSDDDDFLEPLVVKKKKSRKISGNNLLCISTRKVTNAQASTPSRINHSLPEERSSKENFHENVRANSSFDSTSNCSYNLPRNQKQEIHLPEQTGSQSTITCATHLIICII